MNIFSKHLLFLFAGMSLFFPEVKAQEIAHLASVSDGIVAPLRIASDRDGFIYISDAVNGTVSKYDETGALLDVIEEIESPVSVAIDNGGRLFIGDGASGLIYLYDEETGAKEYFKGCDFPSSMAFSPDNTLYISDSRLQKILVLDVGGRLLMTMGEGILEYPTGISFDNNNKRVIVGEHGGTGTGFTPLVKVRVFDLEGNLVNSFGSHGSGDGQFYRVQGLAVGKCGDIYIVDPYQSRLSVFSNEGMFKASFGEFGFTEGKLNIPMDIAFDSQNRMIVSSLNNGVLELFELSDNLPCATIVSQSKMICSGEDAEVEIYFTGTAPWTFTYTVNGIDPLELTTSDNPYILTTSTPGHYEIIALQDASAEGNCFTGSADILISEDDPESLISGDTTICDGEAANIRLDFSGSPPWNFKYTINGGEPQSVITTMNPYFLEATEAGLYEVVELTGGACTGTNFNGSAEVTVIEPPTSDFDVGSEVVLLWPDQTVALDVNLSGEAPWSILYTIDLKDSTTITEITESPYTIIDNRPGSYEIMQVSDSRCSFGKPANSFPDIVPVPEDGLPTSLIATAEFSLCPGEFVPIEVQFTGVPPWTFTYTDETNIRTIHNTLLNPYVIDAYSPGVYQVTALRDSRIEGADFSGSATVILAQAPVAEFSFSLDKQEVSFSNMSLNATTFIWDFGDGNTSNLQSPTHNYLVPGEYTVSLKAINGHCPDSIVSKNLTITAVSSNDLEGEDRVKVYPNPTTGLVMIDLDIPLSSDIEVEVFNQLGMKIHSERLEAGHRIRTIDISGNPEGYYFVKVISGDKYFIEQIILRNDDPGSY